MGLPTMISSISGSLARRSTTVRQSHDCQGKLLSRFVTHSTVSTTSKTDTLVDRRYAGPFTFSGDTLFRVDFPGGYFDEHAYPNYLLTDRLGSVDMVVNINGAVVQHNGYYPYGEPWREPKGNHLLFSAKERLRHVVSDSDYGPRLLSTSLCLWKAPDRLSEKYPWLSPYAYCGANPVKFIDPTGNKIKGVETSDIQDFKFYLDNLFEKSYTPLTSLISTKNNNLVITNTNLWSERISSSNQSDPGAKLLYLIGLAILEKSTHYVEYVKDESASEVAKDLVASVLTTTGDKESAQYISTFGVKKEFINSVWDGGVTFKQGKGSYSLIVPTSNLNKNIWLSIHEIIGHGLPISNKILGDENNSHAIQTENLVRRLLHLPLTDGTGHKGKITNPKSFPSLF